jgi:hypothetical protein
MNGWIGRPIRAQYENRTPAVDMDGESGSSCEPGVPNAVTIF